MQSQSWVCAAGNTLLVPSGRSGMHLFVLTLGPVVLSGYGQAQQVLMASATTVREGIPHDPSCILDAGDHPFIQHRSYIAYRYARVDAASHIESMVSASSWVPQAPCSPELLQRVVEGMRVSRQAPREFKQLFG